MYGFSLVLTRKTLTFSFSFFFFFLGEGGGVFFDDAIGIVMMSTDATEGE